METVEITDPRHPLYGRKFKLDSRRKENWQGSIQIFVKDEQGQVMKIPISATSLAERQPILSSKLTLKAINEFVSLVKQSDLLCPRNRKRYGIASHPRNKRK